MGIRLRVKHSMCNKIIPVFLLVVSACFGRDVKITILHTADLHGHIDSARIEGSENNSALPAGSGGRPIYAGGLLRCATVINHARSQETNVLLIDCGDLFQGTVESYLTRGEVMMKAVKYLRYDALVVGNHEFDWGVERLRALYRESAIPVLDAGIGAPGGETLPNGRPFLVREFEGVRVAIVGLTNPLIPRWQRPRLLGGLQFPSSADALREVMGAVRKLQPDIIVLVVHQGLRQWGDDRANMIKKIAKSFPDFDLIIGAHTHQAVEAEETNRILYTQAGCHGRWLGKVALRYDTEKRFLRKIESSLIAVGSEIKPDPGMQELVDASLRSARKYLREKIGENSVELTAAAETPGQSGVQTLIAAAMAEAADAEVAYHGTLTEAALPAGVVRMGDVWRIVPYENTIGKAWLTISELKEILEENSGYLGKDQFRGVFGITYELHKLAPAGERVHNVRLTNGKPVENNRRISVAVNSYDLASAGDRLPRLRAIMEKPEAGLEETDDDTREAVIEFVRTHSPLNIEAAAGAKLMGRRWDH